MSIQRPEFLTAVLFLWLSSFVSCAPMSEPNEREPSGSDADEVVAGTVGSAAETSCSTGAVLGLSKQIVSEVNCLSPNAYAEVPSRPNLVTGSHVLRYLQSAARDSLVAALDAKPNATMQVNSMLRTPVQQYLLAVWGADGACGVELAAEPGTSNHEGGRAVDVEQFGSWRSTLEARGFVWFGTGDDVHFDFVGSGGDTRTLGVQAFQRLWNRNHPDDPIAEDGNYGAQTESRVIASPAQGFPLGASCGPASSAAIEVYWKRQTNDNYDLRALAPTSIVRVEYFVDGFPIGSATRLDGDNFPDAYGFSQGGNGRLFEVRGFDAGSTQTGRGVGSIDVTAGSAFFIRQLGAGLYEVGLENAPNAVAAVELSVDGFAITDSVSGAKHSTRLAVRNKYNQLGKRSFALSTFNANGSLRGTVTRTFELR